MTDWNEVWRAEDFDLAVQRRERTDSSPALHRVVASSGVPGAVAVCVDEARAAILFVRVQRAAIGRALLELPRGFGDPGDESPRDTAKRELLEETGVGAEPVADLGVVYPDSGLLASRVHAVLLQAGDAGCSEPDGEVDDVEWVGIDETWERVRRGDIADGITLAALHLFMASAR